MPTVSKGLHKQATIEVWKNTQREDAKRYIKRILSKKTSKQNRVSVSGTMLPKLFLGISLRLRGIVVKIAEG